MSDTYWVDGKYLPKDDVSISPLTHTFHYGLGVFEGVRSYEAKDGSVNIFRLKEHTERLLESANITGIEVEYDYADLFDAQIQVVKKSNLKNAYIRPLLYIGSERLGLDIEGIDSHAPWLLVGSGHHILVKMPLRKELM